MPVNNTSSKDAKLHLTFDIDWAPDSSIEEIRRMLSARKLNATFFITHKSDIIADLIKDGHEIGIHPNFLPDSSHGSSALRIVDHLLEIVPNARSMRTHALVQSTPLLNTVFKHFPGNRPLEPK